jgi:hypothetical protein
LHGTGKVLNYNTVTAPTSDLIGNFLLLLLYFGCTTNQRVIPFGYFIYLFRVIRVLDITFSLVKSRSSDLGTTLLKCRIIRISRLLDF